MRPRARAARLPRGATGVICVTVLLTTVPIALSLSPRSLYLSRRGWDVAILDNLCRRDFDTELGLSTLTPIKSIHQRLKTWKEVSGKEIPLFIGDVNDYDFLTACFKEFKVRTRGGVV